MTRPPTSRQEPEPAWLRGIVIDHKSGIPLHVQVRTGLARLIAQRFAPGDAFYSEKTVVEHLPVSKITVSRALQDLQSSGNLRRERGRGSIVLSAPSAVAIAENLPPRFPVSGEPSARAIIAISLFRAPFPSEYVDAIGDHLARICLDRQMSFHNTYVREGLEEASLNAELDRLLTRGPSQEAFVSTFSPALTIPFHRALTARGYGHVALDGAPPGFEGSYIVTDSRAAVRLGLEHLFALGHSRIALLVNEPLDDISVTEKISAFQQIMNERGRSGRVILCNTHRGDDSYHAAQRHMHEVWTQDPGNRPTAVFAVSDPGAWGALAWLREAGVSVPAELSVLGFEDSRTSQFTLPALTTIAHPIAERTQRAVQILLDDPPHAIVQERVAPTLVVRQSTGPARELNRPIRRPEDA